jgi:hypothetical protein
VLEDSLLPQMCKFQHFICGDQRLTTVRSGVYFGIGGLLLISGGVGEWILGKQNPSTIDSLTDVSTGNTFPSTVFFTFGGFWLAFGTTIVPGSGAYSTYSTTGTAADGLSEPAFYATFSFFLVAMAILCSVYSIASIRTNIALFTVLVLLVPCCKYTLSPSLASTDVPCSRLPLCFVLRSCSRFCGSCTQVSARRGRFALGSYVHRLVYVDFDAPPISRLSYHSAIG